MNLKSASFVPVALLALAFSVGASRAKADIIVNGSFQTGDFSGWVAGPSGYPMTVGTSPVDAGDTFSAQIAGYAFSPDYLTQSVADTAAQVYDLSFSYYDTGGDPNALTVTWNGATIFNETNEIGHGFQDVSVLVSGTGADTLQFTDWNNPGFMYLDNVSGTAVSGVPDQGLSLLTVAGTLAGMLFLYRKRAAA